MRFAFIVSAFPALSETFVLARITSLIDRGHSVDIFADVAREEPCMHQEVRNYGLLERTFYASMPRCNFVEPDKRAWGPIKNRHEVSRSDFSKDCAEFGSSFAAMKLFYPGFEPRQDYDIVHAVYGVSGVKAVEMKRLGLRGKLVTSFHGYDVDAYLNHYGRDSYGDLFEAGDCFMPVCSYLAEKLIALGCDEKRVKIIPSPIRTDLFDFSWRDADWLRNSPRLISIARLVEKKGLQYAIGAVSLLRERMPDITYSIVGEGDDRPALVRLVKESGLDDCVRFYGALPHDQVRVLLTEHDIYLAPSVVASNGDEDTIPNAVKEAMLCGLPVISTRRDPVCEYFEDGVHCLLTPERQVEPIHQSILHLIEDSSLRFRMVKAARQLVERVFSIDRIADETVGVYQSLLNGENDCNLYPLRNQIEMEDKH